MNKFIIFIILFVFVFHNLFFNIVITAINEKEINKIDYNTAIFKGSELSLKQKEKLKNCVSQKINSYNEGKDGLKTFSIKNLKDFDNNDYILYEYEPTGYAIYNVSNGDVIEMSPYSQSPFVSYNTDLFYVPLIGYFVKISNNSYYNIMSDTYITDTEEQTALIKVSEKVHADGLEYMDEDMLDIVYGNEENINNKYSHATYAPPVVTQPGNGIVTADKEVEYSWYFKWNKTEFAYDSVTAGGSCGYIALGLLLGYHEFFNNKGYFSDTEVISFITKVNGNPNNENIVPEIDDSFIQYLYNLYPKDGTISSDIMRVMNKFMDGKPISWGYYDRYIFFGSAKSQIDDGYPVILFGKLPDINNVEKVNHAVVVYGYYEDDSKLLTHYGWNYYSQVIISTYTVGSWYAIHNEGSHTHNRYWKDPNYIYCGCGTIVQSTQPPLMPKLPRLPYANNL